MANKYTKLKVDVDQIISLYESGMSQVEIAEYLGLTQKIVFSRLKEAGYKCRVAKARNQDGDNNQNWKGENASYSAFHARIKKMKGMPQKCEACSTDDPLKTYDWASLTGEYQNPNDYMRMCRSCHWKYDQKHLNLKGATGGRPAPKNENS